MADIKKKKEDAPGSDLPGLVAAGLAAAVKAPAKAPKQAPVDQSPVPNEQGTYSKLEHVVNTKMGNSATPEQISGMMESSGVKPEEQQYSGVHEYMKGLSKVDKAGLMEHLKGNRLQVKDIVKGGKYFSDPELEKDNNVQGTKYASYTLPGGEGMKGFYDKIIPDYLNKLGKKHGVKVETAHMPGVANVWADGAQIASDGKKYWVVGKEGDKISDFMDSAAKAMDARKEMQETGKKASAVHTIKLTPEFKKHILKEGFPQYAKGGLVPSYADGGEVSPMTPGPQEAPDQQLDAEFTKAFTPKTKAQAPTHMAIQQQAASQAVNVINPEGELVSIPGEQAQEALSTGGYQLASPEHVAEFERKQKYGSLGQQFKTAAEGAAEAATFGASTGVERLFGVKGEDIRGRREENPVSHMAGQAVGLIGSAVLAPEAGAAAMMERTGAAGAKALGIGAAEAAAPIAKIGSSAVKGAIENMMFQSGDEVSKMFSGDPAQHVETALADIGLAGLIGGGISGGIASASPLWKATVGDKIGNVLKAITDKAGGIEGQEAAKVADIGPALKDLPKGSPGPSDKVRQAAQEYHTEIGTPYRQADKYVTADPQRGARIAAAFEQMKHDPSNPEVKQAYDALINETMAQYQQVKKMGIQIEPIQPGMPNPYPNGSKQVLDDIHNGHLWYFPTDQGFGAGANVADHPMLAPTSEIGADGKPMLANDVFRVVHDIFGHAKEGVGFGPNGEENAWNAHVRMYSPEAAKAMTSETRGQNSWVNFGPHGEFNRANPTQTIYSDQKAGLLPDWVTKEGMSPDAKLPDTGEMTPREAIDHAIETSGMQLAPEVRAGLSSDPEIQNMFKALEQSDTTKSGQKLQQSMEAFREEAGATMSRALGKSVDEIPGKGEIDKYTTGRKIGDTLASEYHAQVDPLAKEYEALRARNGDTQLVPDRVSAVKPDYSNPYMPSSGKTVTHPGTVSQLSDKIMMKAQEEGWTALPKSDIMREIHSIMRVLPKQETLNDLGKLAEAVGAQMQKDKLGNGPLFRAGGIIKSILRESEADVIARKLGDEAPGLLNRFKAVRQAYKEQAELKDALDSRLHAGGSTAGYAKSIREMAQTDGESVLRRLSGVNDADVLDLLQKKFPETAKLVREYHINNVLSAAKEGDTIKGERLVKALYSKSMSPQLRDMIAPPEALAKVNAVGQLLEQFNKMPHNFSNTARTMDKLFQYVPGSATAIAAMLLGHNPLTGAVVGGITKMLGKDVPDAVRLGLLKFLGSDKPIEAGAFKSMVESIHNTIKGESLVSTATKNIFKTGRKVLPESYAPSSSDLDKLDKSLKKLQVNDQPLTEVAQGMQHYMPDHAGAAGQVASRAVNYLNGIRPDTTPKAPLDSKPQPNDVEKASYNKALKIAQAPLTVLEKIQNGNITPKDVAHLQNMYPNLYDKLVQSLSNNMIEAVHKGQIIPYKTRIGLSMFMAQPLDSTMQPMSIIAAQPKPSVPPPQPQGGKPPTGKAATSLQKLPNMYKTPGQSAAEDRSKRE